MQPRLLNSSSARNWGRPTNAGIRQRSCEARTPALSRTSNIMQESTRNPMTNAARLCPTNREPLSPRPSGGYAQSLWILLLAGTMLLSACGGGGASSGGSQPSATLAGNWQFSIVNTPDLNCFEWPAGRVSAAEQWIGDGRALIYSNTLLGSSTGTVQQWNRSDHRNHQRPERRKPHRGSRYADFCAYRKAEF